MYRSNRQRKNNFLRPWLWGKAIKAGGGTPGPLEVSPRSFPPPPPLTPACFPPLRRSVLDLDLPPGPTSSSEGPTIQADQGRPGPSSSSRLEARADTRRPGPRAEPVADQIRGPARVAHRPDRGPADQGQPTRAEPCHAHRGPCQPTHLEEIGQPGPFSGVPLSRVCGTVRGQLTTR